MKETHYKLALSELRHGAALLVVSIFYTVMSHKALSALVISFVANIVLVVSLAEARIERDTANHHATKIELINDSLQGKEIKYYKYHE